MRVLITGAAGFVGSQLAEALRAACAGLKLFGIDNLSRKGSEINLARLARAECAFIRGDIGRADDVRNLPAADWIVDCAADPSVQGGINSSSERLVSDNLIGTLNLLEKCRRDHCGFVMLSTSRVYSIHDLRAIPLSGSPARFDLDPAGKYPAGLTLSGISEKFSTDSPLSLYGATKRASEIMALEYAAAFGFPVWIDRCSNIAGPGQFGKPDQGIYSFWVYQWLLGRPLRYTGFGGEGKQVRDLLDVADLARLVVQQVTRPAPKAPQIVNVGGGAERSISLKELSAFCGTALKVSREVVSEPDTHAFDIPYFVTDNRAVSEHWGWHPEIRLDETLRSIVEWAREHRSQIESGF